MDSATGEVNSLQMRTRPWGRNQTLDIWTFRLERFDREGNRLKPIPVEMQGVASGFVNDGDHITVYGSWKRGVLAARKAYNRTTDSEIKLKGDDTGALIVIFAAFIILILIFIILRPLYT